MDFTREQELLASIEAGIGDIRGRVKSALVEAANSEDVELLLALPHAFEPLQDIESRLAGLAAIFESVSSESGKKVVSLMPSGDISDQGVQVAAENPDEGSGDPPAPARELRTEVTKEEFQSLVRGLLETDQDLDVNLVKQALRDREHIDIDKFPYLGNLIGSVRVAMRREKNQQ